MNPIIEITRVAHGGEGIGHIDGQVCFVNGALPGDRVQVAVTRRSKQAVWADIERIEEPSPDRIASCCPLFETCGGCNWLHFAYPAQAEWKRRIVHDCLTRLAGVDHAPDWVEMPELRLAYRTRARFHAGAGRLGFYTEGSHDIVDIMQCPLCHEKLNAAIPALREARVTGPIEVAVNPEGDEVLVWTAGPHRRLKNLFPLAQSQGDPQRNEFRFDGRPIVNGAFSQSSLLLNRLLVKTVEELAGSPATVLDLYCGNGNLSLGLARTASVLGIDQEKVTVKAAAALGKGQYRTGNEGAFRHAIQEKPWDLILLDPPRTGAKAIAPTLASCKAKAIVYVACDPATLARDIQTLHTGGWQLTRAIALDLFPNTAHVETVCRLDR
jgi:23S rRNA (uracil1939-C5)-methyltransferase